jgi:sigma-E processing peptidase SpoIIGA
VKTVVYVDELLLLNFVVAAGILLATGLVTARTCSPLRLVMASAVAASSSLVLLAPEFPFLVSLLYKILSAFVVVRVCYKVCSVRECVRLCVWYLLLNLLLTGLVTMCAVQNVPVGVQVNNLAVYLAVSPVGLLLGVCGVWLLLRVITACFGRMDANCFEATLIVQDTPLMVRAFWDTGFSVQDPLGGRAVVMVRFSAVQSSLPSDLREYLKATLYAVDSKPLPVPDSALRVRFVSCDTVAGNRLLPAVPAQRICRVADGQTWEKEDLLAVFCGGTSGEDVSWDLLLGQEVAEALGLVHYGGQRKKRRLLTALAERGKDK